MFDVPDDWTVTPADGGLQLVSPDRSSIIIAGMSKADRAGLANWQRAAGRRMVDFGIAFDAKATPPKPPQPLADDSTLAPLMGQAGQPKLKAGELAPLSSVPSMALLGKASDLASAGREAAEGDEADKAAQTAQQTAQGPQAAAPGGDTGLAGKATADKTAADKAASDKAGSDGAAADKVAADKAAAEKAAADKSSADKSAADKVGKPLHFASVVIRGASLAGKPVDVQFLNFGYSKEKWFLMQQESGPDDSRAGAIIKSVRAIR